VIIVSGSSIAFSDHCALITSRALLLALESDVGYQETVKIMNNRSKLG